MRYLSCIFLLCAACANKPAATATTATTATSPAASAAPSAGPACGKTTCAVGEECCNASCGICVKPGGNCIQEQCAPSP